MIGIQISPILTEIESALFEYEANNGAKTEYTMDGFRAGTKIFMSVLMDKIWELQSSEGIEMEDRCKMVMKAGQEIRDLIKKYTDIDTHDLYKTPTKL